MLSDLALCTSSVKPYVRHLWYLPLPHSIDVAVVMAVPAYVEGKRVS